MLTRERQVGWFQVGWFWVGGCFLFSGGFSIFAFVG